MVEVYGIKLEDCFDREKFNNLLKFVSSEKKEGLFKFAHFEDAQRSLIADVLIRYILCERFHIRNQDIVFEKNIYGKPVVLEPKGIHFNISHSGEWVVCAIDNQPVGVDVEYIKPITFNIAKQYFSEYEYNSLIEKEEEQRLRFFYMLWTLKESYIKAVGKGLSIPLHSFSMKIENKKISVENHNTFTECEFQQFQLADNYIVSVCANTRSSKPIKFIDVNWLCQEIEEKF